MDSDSSLTNLPEILEPHACTLDVWGVINLLIMPLSKGPPSHGSQSDQRVFSIHRSEGQKSYFFIPLAMGRVLVHIHGKPKGRGTRIIIDDYAGRNASAGMELIVHKDKISHSDYEAKIESGGANIILLDESGTMVTSVELAEIISETSLSSRNTILR